jgi:hypothetical protein
VILNRPCTLHFQAERDGELHCLSVEYSVGSETLQLLQDRGVDAYIAHCFIRAHAGAREEGFIA